MVPRRKRKLSLQTSSKLPIDPCQINAQCFLNPPLSTITHCHYSIFTLHIIIFNGLDRLKFPSPRFDEAVWSVDLYVLIQLERSLKRALTVSPQLLLKYSSPPSVSSLTTDSGNPCQFHPIQLSFSRTSRQKPCTSRKKVSFRRRPFFLALTARRIRL